MIRVYISIINGISKKNNLVNTLSLMRVKKNKFDKLKEECNHNNYNGSYVALFVFSTITLEILKVFKDEFIKNKSAIHNYKDFFDIHYNYIHYNYIHEFMIGILYENLMLCRKKIVLCDYDLNIKKLYDNFIVDKFKNEHLLLMKDNANNQQLSKNTIDSIQMMKMQTHDINLCKDLLKNDSEEKNRYISNIISQILYKNITNSINIDAIDININDAKDISIKISYTDNSNATNANNINNINNRLYIQLDYGQMGSKIDSKNTANNIIIKNMFTIANTSSKYNFGGYIHESINYICGFIKNNTFTYLHGNIKAANKMLQSGDIKLGQLYTVIEEERKKYATDNVFNDGDFLKKINTINIEIHKQIEQYATEYKKDIEANKHDIHTYKNKFDDILKKIFNIQSVGKLSDIYEH